MTSKEPSDLREQMVARVRENIEHFNERIEPLRNNKRLAFGVDTLMYINDMLGPEGIVEFTRWAVHPRSGFLPQTQRANPAPQELRNVLAFVADEHNAETDITATHLYTPRPKSLKSSDAEFAMMPVQSGNNGVKPWHPFTPQGAGHAPMSDAEWDEVSVSHLMNTDRVARAATRALEAYLDPQKSLGRER